MEETIIDPMRHYLDSAIAEFAKLKALGDKAFAQLSEEDFSYQPDSGSNSISTIVQHLHGNMLSRWTDFLTSDGEKPDRNRDAEFEEQKHSKEYLIQKWDAGWQVLTDTLQSLSGDDMMKQVTIRGEKHSVIQAINRQLPHYGYHVGQIVYIAKHIRSSGWKTLSIVRGRSDEFNRKMKEQQ